MYPSRSYHPDDLNWGSNIGGAPVDKFVAQIVPSPLWTIMSRAYPCSPFDYTKSILNKTQDKLAQEFHLHFLVYIRA